MTSHLGHGRELDPGRIGVSQGPGAEYPPLPDGVTTDPAAGRLDPRAWFADPALPFDLEIGSGKGTFLLQQAQAEPGVNFLGIEWEYQYYAYAADRIRRVNLTNARMLHANAVDFLRWRVPDNVIRVLHLYFSDPWPKAKHHKNRVVQDRFLGDAYRTLRPGGELRIVTDHADYWVWMQEHFARWTLGATGAPGGDALGGGAHPLFEAHSFDPPRSAGEGELVGTNFERKYRLEGRPFNAITLRKAGS